jgi:hypothetical protein
MIRAWAEEFLKWAGEATTANQCDAYIKLAEVWLQSGLRGERFSKEPIPTTEYEWVLSPFSNGVATLHSNEKVSSSAVLCLLSLLVAMRPDRESHAPGLACARLSDGSQERREQSALR